MAAVISGGKRKPCGAVAVSGLRVPSFTEWLSSGLKPQDTLQAPDVGYTEGVGRAIEGGLRRLGVPERRAAGIARGANEALAWTPVGAVTEAMDAGRDARRQSTATGQALGLGKGAVMAALGAVPGGGKVARKAEALAMDEASRMARAREMGFDTSRVWYHGSDANIPEFSTEHLGKNTGAKSAKGGFFFASDPEVASGYAQNSAKQRATHYYRYQQGEQLRHAAYARLQALGEVKHEHIPAPDGGFFSRVITPEGLPPEQAEIYAKAIEDINRSWEISEPVGGNVTPVYLRTENPRVHDYEGKEYRNVTYSKQLTAAKRGKRDSVILQNTYDPATIRAGDKSNKKTDVASVFDPSQIRSVFAAFDPAKRSSGNILAGVAGAAVGIPSFTDFLANQSGEQ